MHTEHDTGVELHMIKVGFIGAGGVSKRHQAAVAQIDGAELTAVFDLNEESARKAAENSGAECFSGNSGPPAKTREYSRPDSLAGTLPGVAQRMGPTRQVELSLTGMT